MLLILMVNKEVDKMLPCGTPCDRSIASDKVDPTARKLSVIDLYICQLWEYNK